MPQYQSWSGNSYEYGSVVQVSTAPFSNWAASYAAIQGGNLSTRGTFVGMALGSDGRPFYFKPSWGGSCEPPPLFGHGSQSDMAPENQATFDGLKASLVSYLNGLPSSSMCAKFFSDDIGFGGDPLRAGYFSQLSGAVNQLRAFDGPTSTMSRFDAGFVKPADMALPLVAREVKFVPVCGTFAAYKDYNGKSHVDKTSVVRATSSLSGILCVGHNMRSVHAPETEVVDV
jgi:hypothetical protein